MPYETDEAEIKMLVHSQRAVVAESTAERRAYQMDCRGHGQRDFSRVFRDVKRALIARVCQYPKRARFSVK